MLKELLKERDLSIHKVSQATGIPYATLNDLVNGKKSIDNCNVSILFKLSAQLRMTMDDLYKLIKTGEEKEFLNFRDTLFAEYQEEKADAFLKKYMSSERMEHLFKESKLKGYYVLCLLDYICDICHIEKEKKFDLYRESKLKSGYYVNPAERYLSDDNFIPEFREYNIYERFPEGNVLFSVEYTADSEESKTKRLERYRAYMKNLYPDSY